MVQGTHTLSGPLGFTANAPQCPAVLARTRSPSTSAGVSSMLPGLFRSLLLSEVSSNVLNRGWREGHIAYTTGQVSDDPRVEEDFFADRKLRYALLPRTLS